MRRLFTITVALLLAVAFALPSSAAKPPKDKNVSNSSMTAYTAQASWGFGSDEDGYRRDGELRFYEMESGVFAEYWDSFWQSILCDEGDPSTPDDDVYADAGFELGTEEGGAPAYLEIQGRYDGAHATVTLTAYGQMWDNCPDTGWWDEGPFAIELVLDLNGTTPILREKDSHSVTIPSFYNEHQSSTFRGRYAEGLLHVNWNADEWDPDGQGDHVLRISDGRIGLMTFTWHSNS